MVMDELDRIARGAAADAHARAAAVAGTEQALRDLHHGVQVVPVVSIAGRRRWLLPTLAAASVVALAVGVTVIARDGDQPRVSSTDGSLPITTDAVPATTVDTVPDTTTLTSIAPAPTTSTSTASTDVDATSTSVVDVAFELGHGLAATLLPDRPTSARTVDSFGLMGAGRAAAITEMWFPDGRGLRIRLGELDTMTYPLRDEASELGTGGWTVEGRDDTVVGSAAGYALTADTWLQVEALRRFDPVSGTVDGRAFDLDELRVVLRSLTYDEAADDRALATSTEFEPATDPGGQPCADATTVAGSGGAGDLVLFTCDGLLARYDGTTGERLEVIATFPDPTAPPPEEGSTPYVDTMAVSPDGTTLWYSVGPEPVSDSLYRYVFGSGVEPEMVADGIVGGVSPDGRWVATATAAPSIGLHSTDRSLAVDDPDRYRGVDTAGTFVGVPVWSPDANTLAAETGGFGALAVIDVATGSITMHAPLAGQVYRAPWFTADGVLHALVDDGRTLQEAVVGPAGNASPIDLQPTSMPPSGRVPVPSTGDFAALDAGRLVDAGQTWATGVLAATVVPA
jgi:hypothetical protein